MPADHGLGLNQDKSLSPSGPETGEPHPQNAVSLVKGEPTATDLPLQHEKLVAKCEILDAKSDRTAEEVGERGEESAKHRIHAASRCSGPTGFLNNLPYDRVLGSHRWITTEPTLPKSLLGKAIGYTQRLWPGLVRFVDDARLPLDTNAVKTAFTRAPEMPLPVEHCSGGQALLLRSAPCRVGGLRHRYEWAEAA